MKKIKYLLLIALAAMLLTGCPDDATVAKSNMTKAADNFELDRRIIFYNTWTGENVLIVEGKCAIEYGSNRTAYICKMGNDKYVRNFVGKSGQITTIVEQMKSVGVNVYHYRRTFKPQSIIPDIDFRGSSRALGDALTPDSSD